MQVERGERPAWETRDRVSQRRRERSQVGPRACCLRNQDVSDQIEMRWRGAAGLGVCAFDGRCVRRDEVMYDGSATGYVCR